MISKGQLGLLNWPGSSWTIAILKKLLVCPWQFGRPISSKIWDIRKYFVNSILSVTLIFLSSTNYFAKWGDFAPPEIMDNLITIEKIEEMTSPRVIKSHLPFYLLPPKLLDTAKVWTRLRQISKSFNYLSENDIRWFTSLAIPKTPSFPSSTSTNWWKCVTTLEKWTTLSTTLSMTNVCSLLFFLNINFN